MRGLGKQAALETGVLLRAQLGGNQVALIGRRPTTFDRVTQRPFQAGPVDLAFDEEVLRAGGDGLGPKPVVDAAGQHHDGHLGNPRAKCFQGAHAHGVRQAEIEQRTFRVSGPVLQRRSERGEAVERDAGRDVREHFGDEQCVARIVFDDHERTNSVESPSAGCLLQSFPPQVDADVQTLKPPGAENTSIAGRCQERRYRDVASTQAWTAKFRLWRTRRHDQGDVAAALDYGRPP